MTWKLMRIYATVAALFLLLFVTLGGYRGPGVAIWGVFVVGMNAVYAVRGSLRAGWRARAHRALEVDAVQAPLREGDCVLEGKVVYAAGADQAMRVDFEQEGSESESSGTWSHRWTETHRKLSVHPFYLVRTDGTRLRVEPAPDQSQLFDELENKILVPSGPLPKRYRFATLIPEERVWITGRLERGLDPEQEGVAAAAAGYREPAPPSAWIVRGNPLLVSSVSLAGQFAARARHLRRHALALLLLLLASSVMVARYVDRMLGTTVVVPITSVATQTGSDEDRPAEPPHVTGYVAYAQYGSEHLESEELDGAPAVGSMMSFRVGRLSNNAGASAHFTPDEMFACFLIACVAVAISTVLYWTALHSLPWYRSSEKLNESGSGRLRN